MPSVKKPSTAKKAGTSNAKAAADKRRDLRQRLEILKREAKELSDDASRLLSRASS